MNLKENNDDNKYKKTAVSVTRAILPDLTHLGAAHDNNSNSINSLE